MKKIKAEFHVHTKYSHDSILGKYALLLMCYLKRVNLIAITDHNEINGALKYREFFKNKGIYVIVGEEVMTSDGEIIGLFLNEKIPPFLSVSETIELIKIQGGLVYVPHPYDEKRYKTVLKYDEIKKNRKNIDFIEIHNGRNIKNEFSVKQEEIQIKLEIEPIIGSDSHTFLEIGRNCVYFEIDNIESIKYDLKKCVESATFKKRNCIKLSHHMTKIVRVMKLMREGKYNELYRIVNKRFKRNKQKVSK